MAAPQATYSSGLGRFVSRESVTLKASGAETATTTGDALELGNAASLSVKVDVTAASGTGPSLKLDIEGSDDNTNWYRIARFGKTDGVALGTIDDVTAFDAASQTTRGAIPGAPFVRYKSTIAGTTPSFTYSVSLVVTR